MTQRETVRSHTLSGTSSYSVDSEFLPFKISPPGDPVRPPPACGHTKSRGVYPGYWAQTPTNQQHPRLRRLCWLEEDALHSPARAVPVHLPAAGRDRARYRRHDGPPRGARERRAERPVVLVSDSERGLDRRPAGVCRWRRALSRPTSHSARFLPGRLAHVHAHTRTSALSQPPPD